MTQRAVISLLFFPLTISLVVFHAAKELGMYLVRRQRDSLFFVPPFGRWLGPEGREDAFMLKVHLPREACSVWHFTKLLSIKLTQHCRKVRRETSSDKEVDKIGMHGAGVFKSLGLRADTNFTLSRLVRSCMRCLNPGLNRKSESCRMHSHCGEIILPLFRACLTSILLTPTVLHFSWEF